MLTFIRKNARLLAKYTTTGSTGFGIDILVFVFLMNSIGMHYLPATVLGFITGSSVHFFLTRRFVFNGTTRKARDAYFLFLTIALAGVTAISMLMYFSVELLNTPPLLSRILIGVGVGFVAYLMHKHISFRYHQAPL